MVSARAFVPRTYGATVADEGAAATSGIAASVATDTQLAENVGIRPSNNLAGLDIAWSIAATLGYDVGR